MNTPVVTHAVDPEVIYAAIESMSLRDTLALAAMLCHDFGEPAVDTMCATIRPGAPGRYSSPVPSRICATLPAYYTLI